MDTVVRAPEMRVSRDSADPAFAELFHREYGPIMQTVYLLVGNRETAEEICQEAFVQLLRHWPNVLGYDRPGAWVRRVAIRLAGRSLRAELRRRSALAELATPGRRCRPTSTSNGRCCGSRPGSGPSWSSTTGLT